MMLTVQDRNELLKAALRSTDKDISDWLVGIVYEFDELPEGRNGIQCPPYRGGVQRGEENAPPNGQAMLGSHWPR